MKEWRVWGMVFGLDSWEVSSSNPLYAARIFLIFICDTSLPLSRYLCSVCFLFLFFQSTTLTPAALWFICCFQVTVTFSKRFCFNQLSHFCLGTRIRGCPPLNLSSSHYNTTYAPSPSFPWSVLNCRSSDVILSSVHKEPSWILKPSWTLSWIMCRALKTWKNDFWNENLVGIDYSLDWLLKHFYPCFTSFSLSLNPFFSTYLLFSHFCLAIVSLYIFLCHWFLSPSSYLPPSCNHPHSLPNLHSFLYSFPFIYFISLFFLSSIQHASWWTRGSSLWSRPRAVQPQVPCSPWQMQCTSPISSFRETGTVHPAPPASSTPARMERATRWLPVHLFESMMSCSPSSPSCTGRSLSSFTRATTVSQGEWEHLMAKCVP